MSIEVLTIENANEESAAILTDVKAKFGFLPNLMGVFAHSPAALKGYLTLSELVDQTTFSPTERQVVLLGVSEENNCEYCIAAHSTISSMQGIDADVVDAVRENNSISDAKLEGLRRFTKAVVAKRGLVSEEDIREFESVGYTKQNVLEVILATAMKTLSNYTNHIAKTPLDAAFEPARWKATAA